MLLRAIITTSLLVLPLAAQPQARFGIEGFGIVSTRHTEIRASISPDGRQIISGSTIGPAAR